MNQGAKQLSHVEGGFVAQDYLGLDKTYYEPTDRGVEAEIAERLAEWKRRKQALGGGE